jgi:hypothetical protein
MQSLMDRSTAVVFNFQNLSLWELSNVSHQLCYIVRRNLRAESWHFSLALGDYFNQRCVALFLDFLGS